MYQATDFSYGNISSILTTFGAISCKVDDTSAADIFVSERSIKTDSTSTNWKNKSRNYFYKMERKPHKFTITLAFNELDDNKARSIAKLFFQNSYQALIPNDTNRIYYCAPTGESSIYYFSNGGYITFEMETFNEYSYSSLITSPKYNIMNATPINIINNGDVVLYPEIVIEFLTGGSSIKIINTNNNNEFLLLGTYENLYTSIEYPIATNEIITINCENETVITSAAAVYRYDNMLKENNAYSSFLEFVVGNNNLNIIPNGGNFNLTFKYRYRYLI